MQSTSLSLSTAADYASTLDRVISELTVLYQAPATAQTPEAAAVWLRAWTGALTAETGEPETLREAWTRLKRNYRRTTWPTPGALIEHVRTVRAERKATSPPPSISSSSAPSNRVLTPIPAHLVPVYQREITDMIEIAGRADCAWKADLCLAVARLGEAMLKGGTWEEAA